jgi:hypothetical protein
MPPREKRLPGSYLLRGEYDLPLPETGQWWISGPFPGEQLGFNLPVGTKFDTGNLFHERPWQKFSAIRGFVDFNHVYRPKPSNQNSPTLVDSIAVAQTMLVSSSDTRAKLRIAWDDHLVIRVNNNEPIDMGKQQYVCSKTVEVTLNKGENTISLWLSNKMGLSRGSWAFSFNAVTMEGENLIPQIANEDN